jgi:hypothetical protein
MLTTRRSFLGQAGAGGLALVSGSAWAGPSIELPLPGRDGLKSVSGHVDKALSLSLKDVVDGLRGSSWPR